MKRSLVLFLAFSLLSGCFLKVRPPKEEAHGIDQPYDFVSIVMDSTTFIEISMSGGYMYGGANPTNMRYDIYNIGTAVSRAESMYSGERILEYDMPREQLEWLAQYIIDQGFFEMRNRYDCDGGNRDCEGRKRHYLPAIPLALTVTIGDVAKTVTVTVFERGMIDYPDGLELIVSRIKNIFQEE